MDIRALHFILFQIFRSWSRKGSVGACDSVEILPVKSISWYIFGSMQFSNLSIMLILASPGLGCWYCNLEFHHHQRYQHTVALLGISRGNTMVFLVSVLVWALILLAVGSLPEEPGMLFLCFIISRNVSVKPVRPDLNVSAILSSFSCCFFQNFLNV